MNFKIFQNLIFRFKSLFPPKYFFAILIFIAAVFMICQVLTVDFYSLQNIYSHIDDVGWGVYPCNAYNFDNYKVNDKLVEDFIDYSNLDEAHIGFGKYTDQLKNVLKASIAQQLFGSNTYEFILNQNDAMLKKVIELEGKDDLE